jgi:ABC-type multidrug transport system ATPase subunit
MPAPDVSIPSHPLPLRIDALTKRFGKVTAVDGVTINLASGECLGLLGPNGAGKSTLIRSIVGRVLPGAGSVSVFGSAADSAEARRALGWVPQELALYSRLTCRENLESFGRYHGLAGKVLLQSVTWCLDWAALLDRADEPVKNLSGGMKRRLNMAAGLIHHPKLILMDEPTVGVDPQSRNRIFEMIEQLHAEGMSIIYTTHPCRRIPAETKPRIGISAPDRKGAARLILSIVRTSLVALQRDRGALGSSVLLVMAVEGSRMILFSTDIKLRTTREAVADRT